MDPRPSIADERLETRLLVEGLHARWGLDVSGRAKAALRRDARAVARAGGLDGIAGLLARAIREEAWRDRLVDALCTRDVTLFRHAGTWVAFRHKVAPLLRTFPRLRLWVPACGTGEDVWALAIVLAEEGLLERSRVWANELGPGALARAEAGAWPADRADAFAAAHARAGGRLPLSHWTEVTDGRLAIRPELRARISFAPHALEAPVPHNAFHVVVCRDALLAYDPPAAERALDVLVRGLLPFGTLVLGRGETVDDTPAAALLERLDPDESLWRRSR